MLSKVVIKPLVFIKKKINLTLGNLKIAVRGENYGQACFERCRRSDINMCEISGCGTKSLFSSFLDWPLRPSLAVGRGDVIDLFKLSLEN